MLGFYYDNLFYAATWPRGFLRPLICCAIFYFTRTSMQHFLYFFPEPHGHGALRPIFTRGNTP
jgi:hypothetical protein